MLSNTCKLKYQGHTGRRVHGLFIQTAMIPRCVYAFLILIVMVLCPCGVRAEDLDQALDSPDIPWNIVADELSYDNAAKVYTAEGNVQISKADKKISADHIRFDHENMKLEASGHIVISSDEDLISADSLSFDLVTEKGQISNGRLYIQKNNFRFFCACIYVKNARSLCRQLIRTGLLPSNSPSGPSSIPAGDCMVMFAVLRTLTSLYSTCPPW